MLLQYLLEITLPILREETPMGMGRGATAGIPEDKGGGLRKRVSGETKKLFFSRENGLFHAVFSNKYSCNVFNVPASLSRPYAYTRPVSN